MAIKLLFIYILNVLMFAVRTSSPGYVVSFLQQDSKTNMTLEQVPRFCAKKLFEQRGKKESEKSKDKQF